MNVKEEILRVLEERGEARTADIVKNTGFSRAYINRFFRELREEGVLTLVGKANKARYIPSSKKLITEDRNSIKYVRRILDNAEIDEDRAFSDIRQKSGVLKDLPKNILDIIEYAFTEMLNNAIEHSGAETTTIVMERKVNNVFFEVRDRGIGAFRNIMEKKSLETIPDAIRDLLKGKQTTVPSLHSGEGIFFTSRVADVLTISSSQKKLIYDNLVDDIFLRNIRLDKGTKVTFSISIDSDHQLADVFSRYTDDSYQFYTTDVKVKLYEEGTNYMSRSQARRLVIGLDKFTRVFLDFSGVETIGQAFADEIFRVWSSKHPEIKLVYKNATENILFMIERAKS